MKYLALIVTLLVLSSCSPKEMTISGTFTGFEESEISLLDGSSVGFVSIPVGTDGSFSYTYDPGEKEHLIAILFGGRLVSLLARNGINSVILLSSPDSSPVYKGDLAAENRYLNKLNDLYNISSFIEEREINDSDPTSFAEYEKLIDEKSTLLYELLGHCRHSYAVKQRKELSETIFRLKNNYINLLDPVDADEAYNAYMHSIDVNDITDAENGQIRHLILWNARLNEVPKEQYSEYFFTFLLNKVTNQKVRNYLAAQEISELFMMPENLTETLYRQYLAVCDDPKNLSENEVLYNKFKCLLQGNPAPDFEMKDREGNLHRLSDLKGTALFIDIWASWCIPCCEEIPYVAELVERFADDPRIQFVSVSIDHDIEAWHQALDTFRPTWAQYLANGDLGKKLLDSYFIGGIPRFIFIDCNGNLISFTAQTPSDETTYDYILNNISTKQL